MAVLLPAPAAAADRSINVVWSMDGQVDDFGVE